MEASISISYRTEQEAKAVEKAVSPDNLEVPKGLSIRTSRESTRVVTRIEAQTKLLTFIATIDDLMNAVMIAERCVSSLKTQ